MLQIGVLTDTKSYLAEFMKKNLEKVFKEKVKINNYYKNLIEKDFVIEDDVILVMTESRAVEIRDYSKNPENIIVAKRTIEEKSVYRLMSLPKGLEVLVVNDNKETTLETVSMLYRLGIKDLKLIPYEEESQYENIKVAVTPDEELHVPKNIETIINIGHRVLDMSTIIEIMNKLRLDDNTVEKNIIQYGDSLVSLDNGIKKNYRDLFLKTEEFQRVLNFSREGIVKCSMEGKIEFYNRSFVNMFNQEESWNKKMIQDVFKDSNYPSIEEKLFEDKLFEFGEKHINVSKYPIISFDREVGFYFSFQEITEIKKLEQKLSQQLKKKGQVAKYNFEDIITSSEAMKKTINLAKKIASGNLTVLITGESGTGKELMAQSIHNFSDKNNQPFVAINCAALPENLLESELFGYEKGAFTGALKEGKKGLFEQAHNGTIFLDEIGDMPLNLQTKLLRVIQERQIMPIGSENVIDIDVRIICATNRDLMKDVEDGRFRRDLYYRLNVLPLKLPALRERCEDVILLMNHYLLEGLKMTEEVENTLIRYSWPGNIRELINAASYIGVMSEAIIKYEDLPPYIKEGSSLDFGEKAKDLVRKYTKELLEEVIIAVKEGTKGRASIAKILQCRIGSAWTEARVRSMLKDMNQDGILNSCTGRGGTFVTEDGEKLLNWMKNRS